MIEGRPVPERQTGRRDPRKASVRAVFASPNDRQWLALDVALNTPDIALVQGPPGTGKTRVIAALQARLAENDEGVDPNGLAGNTLLTSFQHDAVENAAAATRVMGLPAVKVGFRRGSAEVRDGVEIWVTDTVQAGTSRTGRGRRRSSRSAARYRLCANWRLPMLGRRVPATNPRRFFCVPRSWRVLGCPRRSRPSSRSCALGSRCLARNTSEMRIEFLPCKRFGLSASTTPPSQTTGLPACTG